MVDYSKWDNLPSSPSSASGDDDEHRFGGHVAGRRSDPKAPVTGVTEGHHKRCRGAVVFLHGSGDTGEGVREWLASASGEEFERVLCSELGLRVVFPTAPERIYTLAGSTPSTVWFDRVRLSPSAPQDREGIVRSLELLEREVRRVEEDEGLGRSEVFVGGFSMGGGLALEALGHEAFAGRVAGIFGHGSFLSDDSPVWKLSGVPPTRVYMSHGRVDGQVLAKWGRSTAEGLRKTAGLEDLSFREHEGVMHELEANQIAGLVAWISQVVRQPGFGQPAPLAGATGDDMRCPRPPVGTGDGASSRGTDEAGAQAKAPCSVSFEVQDFGGCRCRATFEVPPGSEEIVSRSSYCARGSFFQLEPVGTPGRVQTSFISPKPELTAEAIARRVEHRLANPGTPRMEENCCVS